MVEINQSWSLLPMSAMRFSTHQQSDEGGGGGDGGLECVGQSVFLCTYSDDRLVSILRHRSFLEELQEIALQGEWLSAEDTLARIAGGSGGL